MKLKGRLKKVCYILNILMAWSCLKIFRRDLLKKDIWLIREKRNEARDNGYHFYCYLKENHPEINAYYVITSDSVDLKKILKYGNIIKADSFKHCMYYLAAKNSISSQPFGAYPFHLSNVTLLQLQKLCNKKQKVIFLQHGVVQNKLTKNFIYDQCNIDYFVCSAEKEYRFVKENYQYPEKAIGCVGLARFDKLHQFKTENVILIMPTWRKWLLGTGDGFLCSEFYKAYEQVLTDSDIIKILKEKEWKIFFYLHYQIQDYSKYFYKCENDVIKIANRKEYDVQSLLKSSKILITDYSSVFFDFSYMSKPVLYYQFDKEMFEKSHYEKGYFSYEKDGFGPCCRDINILKEELISLVGRDGKQIEKYQERVDQFFAYRDEKNCERIFDEILSLE